MNHVFVSYSRADVDWVESLVARLAEHEVDTWVDRRDLPVSLPWFDEIEDAIQESVLFLTCESGSSRSSAACAAELAQARLVDKTRVTVSVGGSVEEAASQVLAWLKALPETQILHTELVVRARDWDRAGRPRGLLAGRKAQERLKRGLSFREPGTLATDYLAASRRRSIRRRVLTVAGVFVLYTAIRAPSALRGIENERAESNTTQAELYGEFREAVRVAASDPYVALQDAAGRGDNESALNAALITAALASPVPDDAFTLPSDAARFTGHPVHDTVEVLDGAGERWSRPAAESSARTASPSSNVSVGDEPAPFTVRLGESGIVHVDKGGVLQRTVVVSSRPTVTAVSPDGRELAAAVGDTVDLVDLGSGDLRLTLRGAPGAITDLAWSADGGRIWATAGTTVVSWQRGATRVIVDEPTRSFRGLLSARNPGHAWLLSRDGSLREVDLATGESIASVQIDDVSLFGAASPSADTAVVIGEASTWLVPLHDGAIAEPISLENCDARRPTWSPSGDSFYVPCFRGSLVQFSPDGRETRRVEIPGLGAAAVAVQPRTGDPVVGTADGQVHVVGPDGISPALADLSCGAAFRALATDESALVPVGDGTGLGACSYVGLRDGDGWNWNAYFEDVPANTAYTSVLSTDGSAFVIGYADGSVVLHPTENILPAITDTTLHGAVRDLLVTADDRLYAVTQAGILAEIEMCTQCASNESLAQIARRRLDRAVELGLA